MKVDLLFIGQGLAGTWLSYFAQQSGRSFCVVDGGQAGASAVASGVVNPVTGRGVHTTWMAAELIPFAQAAYAAMELLLQRTILLNTRILALPPTEEMRVAYEKRMKDDPTFVQAADSKGWEAHFRFSHGQVAIAPALVLNVQAMLEGWRQWLRNEGRLLEQHVEPDGLQRTGEGWRLGEVEARHVVFARGASDAQDPLWQWLPFALNKGEALVLDVPALPGGQVYKFGITTFVPWRSGRWWLGSTYDNRFTDLLPSATFAAKTQAAAAQLLQHDFGVAEHLVGLRPATIDRRPFVGAHPSHAGLWMLNGLGTKGCSLAPYFAHQLLNHIFSGQPLLPEVSLARFERIFKRSIPPGG